MSYLNLVKFDRGQEVFLNNCIGCHGQNVESSTKRDINAELLDLALSGAVKEMKHLSLSVAEKDNLIYALKSYRSIILSQLEDNEVDRASHLVCSNDQIKSSAVRKLNRREYVKTIGNIFDIKIKEEDLPKDFLSGSGYDNNGLNLIILENDFQKYFDIAENIANQASTKIINESTCDLNQFQSNCFKEKLKEILGLLFRGSVNDDEIKDYEDMVSLNEDIPPLQLILTSALISPKFLFLNHNDKSGDQDLVKVKNSHEIVTRLSLLFWSSTPDQELLDLAETNSIDGKALKYQIYRLLDDKRSDHFVNYFMKSWLGLSDLDTRPKEGDASTFKVMAPQLIKETTTFFRKAIDENIPVNELITAEYTYLNRSLANYYDYAPGSLGEEMTKFFYPEGKRKGILTHASYLGSHHRAGQNLITKGARFMQRVLCVFPNTTVSPEDIDATSEVGGDLLKDKACATCHSFINPLGNSLAGFDEFGRWLSSTDESMTSGHLPNGRNFSSAHNLMTTVSEGDEFRSCMGEHLAMFALGRDLSKGERCFIRNIVRNTGKNEGVKDWFFRSICG